MKIQIVMFPETKVAAIEHYGSSSSEHDTVRKLIAWKLEQKLLDPAKYRSYGVHYTDPRTTRPSDHHVDFCLSIDRDVDPMPSASSIRSSRGTGAHSPVTSDVATTTRLRRIYTKNGCLGAGRHRAPSRFSFTTSTSARISERKV
jgi:GyrI-like small molecule binding domain